MQPSARTSDYVPSLDGMRAISILLVFLAHFGFGIAPGIFGVTIFFFISGYLITGLLLTELSGSGTIALGAFYVRRMLRLFPALLVMAAVSAVVFPLIGGIMTVGDMVGALLYLANYWPSLTGGFDAGTPHGIHPFAVLWSLAVEEHYYLVFPMLCLLFGGRTLRFAAIILGLIVVVTVWRFHVAAGCAVSGCPNLWIEHATDTRADSIFYGALLATLMASPWQPRVLAATANVPAFAAGMLLLLASLLIRDPWFRDTWRFSVQGIGLFLAVPAILNCGSLLVVRHALSLRPVLLVGRWSYSLYLWHWVVASVCSMVLPVWLWMPVIEPHAFPPAWWMLRVFLPAAVASLSLAAASYYGVERPMVRLRRRFGSHAVADRTERGRAAVEAPAS